MSSAGSNMTAPANSFNVRKMLAGELFQFDENTGALLENAQKLATEYNGAAEAKRREEILHELLGSRGKQCTMTPTIGFDYGWNTHVGDSFYANMGLLV